MMNPKHHDWAEFQMLHFSVPNFTSCRRNISSKKWLRDLFFNEDSHISSMIFHSRPRFKHNFNFHKTNVFSLIV